jgi:hypothetical protein
MSKEEKLRTLLRPRKPLEERSPGVELVTVHLPLSKKAQAQPMLAWKQVLTSLTGHRPLYISLLNPCNGEVFLDSRVAPAVREVLSKEGYLRDNVSMGLEKDLVRRKQVYLNGYFLPLRREALRGFSLEQKLKLLDLAALESAKLPDAITRRQWKYQIAKDRSWVQEDMEV